MAISNSTSITTITSSDFLELGFTYVGEYEGGEQYIKGQYWLFYDSTTNIVKVKEGRRSYTVSWEFISIVLDSTELETLLSRNGII